MVGSMVVGENIRKIKIRYKNKKDFETYINSLDENGYESDDAVFTGYNYNIETPVLLSVNRLGFGKGTHFRKNFIYVIVDSFLIPKSKLCFIKCTNF